MKSGENKKIAPLIEYFSESATARLVTMVQGNFLAITASHLIIASQTGAVAGVSTALALAAAKTRNRWIISLTLGLATGIADYFMHPGMFGSAATEAIVTGIGAAVISYLVGLLIRIYRERKTGTG